MHGQQNIKKCKVVLIAAEYLEEMCLSYNLKQLSRKLVPTYICYQRAHMSN
jgi:hypothetical protein